MKKAASTPARSVGSEAEITMVRLPRKIAPLPAPQTIPPARNRLRLGGEVQAEATSRP